MGYKGRQLWLNPAIWAITIYRFGNWLYTTNPFVLVRVPLKVVYFFAYMFSEVVMEMCLDPQATIGGGLYIAHIGGIHINPQAIVGSNCDIAHRVTIGASAMGRQGAPVLGDKVYIGTGATLVGKIKVGKWRKDRGQHAGHHQRSRRRHGDGCAWTHHHAGPQRLPSRLYCP